MKLTVKLIACWITALAIGGAYAGSISLETASLDVETELSNDIG